MRRTSSRLGSAALVLLTAFALSACTSDGPPSPPTSVATTKEAPETESAPASSPPATPTATLATGSGPNQDVTKAPPPPDALGGPATESNAVEVGKYFMALFPYAVATGDLGSWNRLSGPDCHYCATLRSIVVEMADAKQHGTGGAYDIGFSTGSALDEDTYILSIELKQYPSQTLDDDGNVVDDYPDVIFYRANIETTWDGSRWIVDGVDMVELSRT